MGLLFSLASMKKQTSRNFIGVMNLWILINRIVVVHDSNGLEHNFFYGSLKGQFIPVVQILYIFETMTTCLLLD